MKNALIRLNTLGLLFLILLSLSLSFIYITDALKIDTSHYQYEEGKFNPSFYLQRKSTFYSYDDRQSQEFFDLVYEASITKRKENLVYSLISFLFPTFFYVLISSIISWVFGSGFVFHLDNGFKEWLRNKTNFDKVDRFSLYMGTTLALISLTINVIHSPKNPDFFISQQNNPELTLVGLLIGCILLGFFVYKVVYFIRSKD